MKQLLIHVVTVCLALLSAAAGAADTAIHDVMVAAPAKDNSRNTEGDIVELKDGTLLLVYTRFRGGTSDAATADLSGMHSKDGGRTWGKPFLVQENDAKQNVMSVSLLRLKSGDLMLGYLRKNSDRDCRYVVRRSSDEGTSWGRETMVTEPVAYYVVNNDRLVQLSGGRLLVPAADHGDISKRPNSPAVCYCSDDEGKTWRRGPGEVRLRGIGCQEPGVVELKDGRVYMILRNSLGSIYRAISADGGLTWGEPASTGLTSPVAPASISRIPSRGELLMIWNNSPKTRVPLTAAISTDEGQTWKHIRDLEVKGKSFAYTSITWVRDTAVLSHWTQLLDGYGLKVKVVPVPWFYRD
jgi:Neuraminidase (sialidase)